MLAHHDVLGVLRGVPGLVEVGVGQLGQLGPDLWVSNLAGCWRRMTLLALPDLIAYSADSTMEQEDATVSATLSSMIPNDTS